SGIGPRRKQTAGRRYERGAYPPIGKPPAKRRANLLRHVDEVDLVCPRCGSVMKIIPFLTERQVIRSIPASLRRGQDTPSAADSRHPPPPAGPAADGV
ncbi:MAG TPA: hypothetical protein VNL91_10955, partial [Thermoanaerobaculia bacterium]|nr:hypothetical protein [Thermoanaerobaculia bacterium]